jgi:hypothetical protein
VARRDRRTLEDLFREREALNERLRTRGEELRGIVERQRQLVARMEGTAERVEQGVDHADVSSVLDEAQLTQQEWTKANEEFEEAKRDVEEAQRNFESLGELIDEKLEGLRLVALETEKQWFEFFKLIATLGTASVLGVAAIAAAFSPRLPNLEELWPTFWLLLASIGFSVIVCFFISFNISALLASTHSGPRRSLLSQWLPQWALNLLGALPYGVLFPIPFVALIWGIFKFMVFITANLD